MFEIILVIVLSSFILGGGFFLARHDPNLARALRFEIAPWHP